MVNNVMYHEIKALQRAGMAKKKIARELGIDTKTVRKYWSMNEPDFSNYMDYLHYREKEFDCYRKEVLELYKKNEYKKVPVSSVYDYLEECYGKQPANENSLRNYIRYLIETNQLNINNKVRYYSQVPEMPYGKQIQLDFGEYPDGKGGKYYIFGTVLSASRFKYATLQEKPFKTMDLIQHLLNCFDYIGGIPEEMVIDQDSIMVTSENAGDILYTKDFKGFIDEMGIKMFVCRKADPESKGKIENMIKFIKNNFFSVRKFDNIVQANESINSWLTRRANGKISQATKQIPLLEIEEERKSLKPLRNSIYRKDIRSARELRTVSDKCRITVESCQYDLPLKYRNRDVEIYRTEEKLFVFDMYSGIEIVDYELSKVPGKIVSRRDIHRDKGVRIEELKAEVSKYYDMESWKQFLNANFSYYSRYVRDQCIDARKFFSDPKIDKELMEKAIKYCLENQTLSMRNLNDSCKYFQNNQDDTNDRVIKKILDKIQRRELTISRGVDVSMPDISKYQSIIQIKGGMQ